MVNPRLFAGGLDRKWVFPRQGCSVRSEQGMSLTPASSPGVWGFLPCWCRGHVVKQHAGDGQVTGWVSHCSHQSGRKQLFVMVPPAIPGMGPWGAPISEFQGGRAAPAALLGFWGAMPSSQPRGALQGPPDSCPLLVSPSRALGLCLCPLQQLESNSLQGGATLSPCPSHESSPGTPGEPPPHGGTPNPSQRPQHRLCLLRRKSPIWD